MQHHSILIKFSWTVQSVDSTTRQIKFCVLSFALSFPTLQIELSLKYLKEKHVCGEKQKTGGIRFQPGDFHLALSLIEFSFGSDSKWNRCFLLTLDCRSINLSHVVRGCVFALSLSLSLSRPSLYVLLCWQCKERIWSRNKAAGQNLWMDFVSWWFCDFRSSIKCHDPNIQPCRVSAVQINRFFE